MQQTNSQVGLPFNTSDNQARVGQSWSVEDYNPIVRGPQMQNLNGSIGMYLLSSARCQ